MRPVLFCTSYQVLNAGHVAWVYGDRIIEAILGLRKVFFKLENAATLCKKIKTN